MEIYYCHSQTKRKIVTLVNAQKHLLKFNICLKRKKQLWKKGCTKTTSKWRTLDYSIKWFGNSLWWTHFLEKLGWWEFPDVEKMCRVSERAAVNCAEMECPLGTGGERGNRERPGRDRHRQPYLGPCEFRHPILHFSSFLDSSLPASPFPSAELSFHEMLKYVFRKKVSSS